MDKICGLDDRFEMLNERLTLIEKTVGINSYMSIGEGNVGNVGVGSTAPASKYGPRSQVPPDVARYQELVAAQAVGNVGDGNVGIGSTAPAGTTETEPDTAVEGGQSDPAPAPGDGNVGVGSTAPGESQRERIERRARERAEETAPSSGNVGSGEAPDPAAGTSEAEGWPRSDGNVGEKQFSTTLQNMC